MSVISEIQVYLAQYRDEVMNLDHITTDEISDLKGCQIRSKLSQESDYKRGWTKLAKAQKLNRLMDYRKKITTDYNLTTEQQGQLKSLFYKGVDSSILERDHVCYNSNQGCIVNITGLKQDHDGIFYFANESDSKSKANNSDPSKPKNTEIPSIKKFAPLSIEQLTIPPPKQTKKNQPLIIKKKK